MIYRDTMLPICESYLVSKCVSTAVSAIEYPVANPPHLREEPSRVSREQTAHPDVRQSQPELHDAFQAETTTGVRRTSIPERVDVILRTGSIGVDRWVVLLHHLRQQVSIVDTLGSRTDFLSAHEHVVRVGKLRVSGRGHGVGWADGERELVERVEVRAVFCEDEAAEMLFLRCPKSNVNLPMWVRRSHRAYVKSS
jgi:hypothetical protein